MKAITKFNGEYTFTNTMTGERRTFRIKTQPKDAKFCPGARLVSLLTGPDNEHSYTGFAFLNETQTPMIHIYHKKDNKTHRYYARLLESLESDEGEVTIGTNTYEVLQSTVCRKCNRKLTTPESIESGIGPVCAGRVRTQRDTSELGPLARGRPENPQPRDPPDSEEHEYTQPHET